MAEYAPGLTLNFRQRPEGGEIRRPGVLTPPTDPRRSCLVLVHGYNNHQREASAAYLGFRDRQYAQFADLAAGALERRLGDVFWPGDADWPGPLDWLDFLVYPAAVGTAVDVAAELAVLLARLPNLEQVDFLGHSLGCRVILEAALLVHRRGYPRIGKVCLMAAAVPVEMLEPGGRFERLMLEFAAENVPVAVLHSSSDRVLRFAFPPGQALAGEPSVRALGLRGAPPGLPANVARISVPSAGHGDYWGHNDGEAARAVASTTGEFFRLGAARRPAPARVLGAARELGARREIGVELDWLATAGA